MPFLAVRGKQALAHRVIRIERIVECSPQNIGRQLGALRRACVLSQFPGLVSSTQSVWILSGVVCRSKLPDYEQRVVAGESDRQHGQIMIKLSAHVRILDV